MGSLILLIVAVAPVILFMLVINFNDKIEKEPFGLQFALMGMGVLSTIPAMLIELLGAAIVVFVLPEDSIVYVFIENFFIVAITEEACKFLFMLMITWKNRAFDYAFDGVVYAVATSLGFALLENIIYVFSDTIELGVIQGFLPGLGVGISRAFLAIPLHTSVAIFMGFFYGKAKEATFQHKLGKSAGFLTLALAVPMLIHGIYDYALSVGTVVMIVFFGFFVVFMYIFTICMCIYFSKHDHNITGRLKVKITKDGWLRYAITDQREIVILGLTRPFQGQILVIPEVIEHYPVRIIARRAFAYTNVVNVKLPSGLRLIDDTAFFNCPYLQTVIMPERLMGIGNYAFEYCYNLRQILLPHVNFLGNHIFDGCNNLTDIYYLGSQQEWTRIRMNIYENLTFLQVHFYYNTIRK